MEEKFLLVLHLRRYEGKGISCFCSNIPYFDITFILFMPVICGRAEVFYTGGGLHFLGVNDVDLPNPHYISFFIPEA